MSSLYFSLIIMVHMSTRIHVHGLPFIEDTQADSYIGCYAPLRHHKKHPIQTIPKLTIDHCRTACSNHNFTLAALRNGTECVCTDVRPLSVSRIAKYFVTDCYSDQASPCAGNPQQICGSPNSYSLYCVQRSGCQDVLKLSPANTHGICPEENSYCALRDCPETCSNDCERRYGQCTASCEDGHYGPFCLTSCPVAHKEWCKECPDGFAGINCDVQCPEKCEDKCSKGGMCYECPEGSYGTTCSLKCPVNCLTCAQMNGTCLQCSPGYYGYNKHLNQHCHKNCKQTCASCDRISANCLTCYDGLFGRACRSKCDYGCLRCVKENGQCLERSKNNRSEAGHEDKMVNMSIQQDIKRNNNLTLSLDQCMGIAILSGISLCLIVLIVVFCKIFAVLKKIELKGTNDIIQLDDNKRVLSSKSNLNEIEMLTNVDSECDYNLQTSQDPLCPSNEDGKRTITSSFYSYASRIDGGKGNRSLKQKQKKGQLTSKDSPEEHDYNYPTFGAPGESSVSYYNWDSQAISQEPRCNGARPRCHNALQTYHYVPSLPNAVMAVEDAGSDNTYLSPEPRCHNALPRCHNDLHRYHNVPTFSVAMMSPGRPKIATLEYEDVEGGNTFPYELSAGIRPTKVTHKDRDISTYGYDDVEIDLMCHKSPLQESETEYLYDDGSSSFPQPKAKY